MTNKTKNIRHPLMQLTAAAMCIAAFTGSMVVSAAEMYRWTDENGVIHMSDKRPENREVEVLKPRAPTPRTFKQQAEAKEAKLEAEKAAEEEAAEKAANAPLAIDPNASKELRCQQERERLSILNNNSVVHMQDANGNLKTLTSSEIQQEIAVTQKAIDALCD